jgi:amidohydrolase family protein
VRQAESEGWDFVEILPTLTSADYRAIVREARELGMPFGGHLPDRVTLAGALEVRQPVTYLEEYALPGRGPRFEQRLRDVAVRSREAGVAVIPGFHALNIASNEYLTISTLGRYPELRFMPPRIVRRWRAMVGNGGDGESVSGSRVYRIQRLLKVLHDRGVAIMFGTGSPGLFSVPGFSLHREMRLMQQAGLRPYEVLRSATRNVGEHFRAKDRFGTMEVGARADLILLDANPLIDLNNLRALRGVMVRGQWLDNRQ